MKLPKVFGNFLGMRWRVNVEVIGVDLGGEKKRERECVCIYGRRRRVEMRTEVIEGMDWGLKDLRRCNYRDIPICFCYFPCNSYAQMETF